MDKIAKLQRVMPFGMGAAIFRDGANRFYLTGMKSSAGTVLVTKERAWLIIDFRYLEEAEKKVRNCIVIEEKQLYGQIRELLLEEGITRLSVHSEVMGLGEYRRMEAALPEFCLDGSEALAELMDSLRGQKDEDEIACHRKAQQITDHVFDHICGYIRRGFRRRIFPGKSVSCSLPLVRMKSILILLWPPGRTALFPTVLPLTG